MKYKDTQNKVHEIPAGFEKLMPGWPIGYTSITDAEATVLLTPILTLAESKVRQIAKINTSAQAAFDAITSAYPKSEVDTWPNQYWDALSYVKNPLDNLVILPRLALESGIPLATLVNTVLAKAAAFNDLSATIVGKRKKLTDQVNAALTNAAVEAIVW